MASVFPGLQLSQVNGLDLDLSSCELTGSCFKEARFGHAQLSNANVQGCCFQEALLWGADLSNLQAQQSFWHEADLSGSRMQKADFSEAVMHRCCLRGVIAANSTWHTARLVEADFRSGLDQLTDLGKADFNKKTGDGNRTARRSSCNAGRGQYNRLFFVHMIINIMLING